MKVRAAMSYVYGCTLSEELLACDLDDLPEDIQKDSCGLGCEGGGVPGSWCRGCRWGVELDQEEYDTDSEYWTKCHYPQTSKML